MPESGSDILNYRGDAALGQGSNAGIPVINPNNNLDVINNAANNISMLNHDDNIKLYNQKIQDRDTALQMLQQGQIASGAIDDSDRPFYDEAKKAASDQFYNMMQNGGINNTDAYRKYLDKSKELANVVTQAQGRNLEMAKLNQERSQQALPQDQQDYDAHIKAQQAKPFWQPIDPYQKAFNYDLPSLTSDVSGQPSTVGQLGSPNVSAQQNATTKWNSTTNKNGVITQKETTKTSPTKTGLVNNKTAKQPITISGQQVGADGQLNPYSYTPEKYYDLGSIQKNVDENYATDPEKRFAYQSYFNDFQDPNKLPPPEQKKTIEAYNNRIADYSNQRGIQPIQGQFNPDGSPTYPNQIKYHQNTDGSVIVQETPASFFAKHALASINGDYVEKPEAVFNKDIGSYNVMKQKADADTFYKHALAGAAQTKAGAYLKNIKSQIKARGNTEDQDNFLNEIYTKNITQQPLVIGRGGSQISLKSIEAQNSLPVFTLDGKTPKQLIPIGGTAVPSPDGKSVYYQGGHYDPQYLLNDKPLSVSEISNNYQKFKQVAGKNWSGSLEDYMREAVKRGLFKVNLKGENGTTNQELSLAAQRIISNSATKKGQDPVFGDNNPPTDDQATDSQDNQQ